MVALFPMWSIPGGGEVRLEPFRSSYIMFESFEGVKHVYVWRGFGEDIALPGRDDLIFSASLRR